MHALLYTWVAGIAVLGLTAGALGVHPRASTTASRAVDTLMAVWIFGGLIIIGAGGGLG